MSLKSEKNKKDYYKKRYTENKEMVLSKNKIYRKSMDKEQQRIYNKRWNDKNKEKKRILNFKYRLSNGQAKLYKKELDFFR